MTVSYWRGNRRSMLFRIVGNASRVMVAGQSRPENYQRGQEGKATGLIYDGRASAIGLLQPDSGLTVERIFQQDGLFPARSDRNQNDFGIQKLLDTLNVFLRGCRQLGKLPHCG
jgi:hypothetical protein